ncbi:PREDICTED: histone acetyltransferase HAC1-like [Tarenaya hassleriana]|uniref:histone acetyltransferase HAC1-like n=1 Tax=Tarenaya hassleriana TaxID=28532 RepID=UPI00053C4142|nr:PREDICTED: histone acetyltransferase HAC1-like [Tarenaya hassleriana]XP_010531961.1 PREDICTED: histone acetyltransferase HAC1-like [Tarenaya hassleriana]XP_010531962.1 PREDICTED: histone acetyltransferase HAC1-like [Tarenaya hassleriana]
MNVQAHMSGQISGQVPNQGTMAQQNGNSQMQNSVGGSALSAAGVGPSPGSVVPMDHEILKLRQYMRSKIFNILQQRQPSPADDASKAKYMDVARRLEEGLFKMAVTKEDYMNPQTLESRLTSLIKGRQFYNQRHANSSSVGTMIPTPGLPHSRGNSNMMVTSSIDTAMVGNNNIATSAMNTGSLLAASSMHGGNLSNGYQQSSGNFGLGAGGTMASMSMQRMPSQMIPTPGFVNNGNNNGNSSGQSYMSVETSNNGGFSAAEPAMVPQLQQQQQRQHFGGQNSRILHNLGSQNQMGAGFRPGMQQKSPGVANNSLSSGMGMNSKSVDSSLSYTNSPRNLHQTFDNLQRPGMHGEGYGATNPDPFGSGNLYGAVTSAGTMTNAQNIITPNLHPVSRANSSLSHKQQQFQHQPNQFQQQSNQFQQQQQQQFLHQHQLKQQSQQQQRFISNDVSGKPQVASDLVTHVKHESGMENPSEVMHSLASEQFQLSQFQNQFQNSVEDCPAGPQLLSVPATQNDICTSLPQSTQQIQQMLNPQNLGSGSIHNYSNLSVQPKSESGPHGQWQSQSQENSQMSCSMPNEQNIQEDFRQRMSGMDEAQPNNLSLEGSIIGQSHVSRPTSESHNPQNPTGSTGRYGNINQDPRFKNQQRWLLFLRHARFCKAPEGKCHDPNCITVQKLWEHLYSCTVPQCRYPRCHPSKVLINHHKNCKDSECPVCVPVKNYLQQQANARALARLRNENSAAIKVNGAGKSNDPGGSISGPPPSADISDNLQPSLKRLKVEQSFQPVVSAVENFKSSVDSVREVQSPQDVERKDYRHSNVCAPSKLDTLEVKVEVSDVSGQAGSGFKETKNDISENISKQRPVSESVKHDKCGGSPKQEICKIEKETEAPRKENLVESPERASKSGKPTIKGVSLTELFTPEQVREHIRGLRQWVGQSKAKAEKHQAMEHSMSENSCQLCAVEKLTFEPPPIYCTPCGCRIKRNANYYTVGAGDTRHYFCIPCYNDSRGDTILAEGTAIPKARLEKKKNDEETEEWWVQCDKCEAWQHQICALFNGRRNDGGQAEYTCPYCYIAEVERVEREPLPQSAVLGAKDLPRTILSDHIEQRLFRRLKHERMERARIQGKSYDEIPSAEALVIRVVSSVDKKLEVKPRFLEIFKEDNYPTEFPYKSKVVLLFQKIEGVEVCLFGMYVQEFGSECSFPNQRRVYLSYLDSVKYFRPDVKAFSGEALRTFVYHEILIGYLEYCKLRGFTSCYIWACPPLKGEDYILYCHPEIQKTPKSDKLREWYLAMLRKASKEGIVVETTNLYDHFFIQTGECRAKVTAARLPYFDGDYWPGAAEDLIYQMSQEEDGRKGNKKGILKKTITKRALKASGQSDLSGNASKDLLLMHKLGETIHPMKEDFIMVHLQHCCTHCCILMVSGIRWVCSQCKNFQICEKCYEVEQKREDRERHPVNQKDKHTLYPVEITDVNGDTKDKDEILESEFFDTRQAFLSLCQGNHYQYDTLRRAKHSSMMVLYHLHNPTAPAFVTTCNACHLDIETGQGWRCEVCPDYDVCNACYNKDGGTNHPHKLTNHPSLADQNAQNKEARQLRVLQLRKMLDLLVHASQCRSPHCQYPNCRKVKGLFRHGIQCKVRASGGCVLCKKMWYLLQLHARACKESKCHVPRCRDLKEHLRRLQQQSDSRRRAAVMEMMRQRAAEVAGNSS